MNIVFSFPTAKLDWKFLEGRCEDLKKERYISELDMDETSNKNVGKEDSGEAQPER